MNIAEQIQIEAEQLRARPRFIPAGELEYSAPNH